MMACCTSVWILAGSSADAASVTAKNIGVAAGLMKFTVYAGTGIAYPLVSCTVSDTSVAPALPTCSPVIAAVACVADVLTFTVPTPEVCVYVPNDVTTLLALTPAPLRVMPTSIYPDTVEAIVTTPEACEPVPENVGG